MTKILKHNNLILHLEPVEIAYKVQMDRFKRRDVGNNLATRYATEYKIKDCNHQYNQSGRIIDWKYKLDNIRQYPWILGYIQKG